jgi:3-polyprenyl-4-hydroxybenzoate decarboxylase
MQYESLLRLALVPSIVFFLLSLLSVVLTTHYWILGDWFISRWVKVMTAELDERTQKFKVDDTIVWYTEKDTNVTIASGCLCLTAAIVALIAWSTLRKPDMDSQLAAVCICRGAISTSN